MYNNHKLNAIGMDGNSVNWFDSYLTGRSQVVDIDGVYSQPMEVTCGVPQGSILGPLLFLVYVNDMVSAVNCKLLLYADDSALMVSHKEIGVIQEQLSIQLESVNEWLVDNKLSLHLGKTESVLFGSKRKLAKSPDLDITCGKENITPKSEIKYLGLDIHQTLNGEITAEKVIKKANSRLKFLHRKGKFLNVYTKKLLVSALIQCHYDYACSTWYLALTKQSKHRLQTTQNKIIRSVLNLPSRSHIGFEEFKKVNWLPVNSRVSQIVLNHMFKIVNKTSPSFLQDNIIRSSKIHNHSTRSGSQAIFQPRTGTHGQKSFYFNGIKLWNSLPHMVQTQQCKDIFKKEVKQHLFNEISRSERAIFTF